MVLVGARFDCQMRRVLAHQRCVCIVVANRFSGFFSFVLTIVIAPDGIFLLFHSAHSTHCRSPCLLCSIVGQYHRSCI